MKLSNILKWKKGNGNDTSSANELENLTEEAADDKWALEIPSMLDCEKPIDTKFEPLNLTDVTADDLANLAMGDAISDDDLEKVKVPTYSLQQIMSKYKFTKSERYQYTGNGIVLDFEEERVKVMFAYNLNEIPLLISGKPSSENKIKDSLNAQLEKINLSIKSKSRNPINYLYDSKNKMVLFEYFTDYLLSINGIGEVIKKADSFNKRISIYLASIFKENQEKIKTISEKKIIERVLPYMRRHLKK